MDELVAFLRARLAEDEQMARAVCGSVGPWIVDWEADDEQVVRDQDLEPQAWPRSRDRAVHIARHDPTRVLADVAAKRHIIEQCELRGRAVRTATLDGGFFEHLLRVLALPFSEHRDYRKEWRP